MEVIIYLECLKIYHPNAKKVDTLFVKYAKVKQARGQIGLDIATINYYSTVRPLIYTVCLLPVHAVYCLTYYTFKYCLSSPLSYFQTLFTYCPSPLFINCPPPLQTGRPLFYIMSFPALTYCHNQ